MIVHHRYQQDGMDFVRTFSDAGWLIECEGILYKEAIDFAFNIDKKEYREVAIPLEELQYYE